MRSSLRRAQSLPQYATYTVVCLVSLAGCGAHVSEANSPETVLSGSSGVSRLQVLTLESRIRLAAKWSVQPETGFERAAQDWVAMARELDRLRPARADEVRAIEACAQVAAGRPEYWSFCQPLPGTMAIRLRAWMRTQPMHLTAQSEAGDRATRAVQPDP